MYEFSIYSYLFLWMYSRFPLSFRHADEAGRLMWRAKFFWILVYLL